MLDTENKVQWPIRLFTVTDHNYEDALLQVNLKVTNDCSLCVPIVTLVNKTTYVVSFLFTAMNYVQV